jgi:uncharacterized protein
MRAAAPREPVAIRRALAIVARYPRPGKVKTRLAAGIGHEAAAQLYAAFLRDLAARFGPAAAAAGYALIWAQAPGLGDLREMVGDHARLLAQRGVNFADRLHAVAHDLAALGFDRTIIASSDSPHLPAERVREAFTALDHADVVLGPATDGGYYLIGFHATPAPPDLFRGITMSTARVLADTVQRAESMHMRVHLLPPTFDVDEPTDLPRLACALAAPGSEAAAAPHTLAVLRGLRAPLGALALGTRPRS